MKLTYGRKFFSCIVGLVLLQILFFGAGIINPKALTGAVLIIYGILTITLVMLYIGGNVWKYWVRSKYFMGNDDDTENIPNKEGL